jgi:hypothetical protein
MLVPEMRMSQRLNCRESHCLWKLFNTNLDQKAGESLESHQEHPCRIGTPTYGRVLPKTDGCSYFYMVNLGKLCVWLPLGFIPYDLKFLQITFYLYSYCTIFQ